MGNATFYGKHQFAVVAVPPTLEHAIEYVQHQDCGAVATFIGNVRAVNVGRQVVAVEYEVHAPLAQSIMDALFTQLAAENNSNVNAWVSHMQGRVTPGQTSVVIAVATPHRQQAFAGCRFLIEEIKNKMPIWKKEQYTDGASEWVQGHALCQHG